MTEPYGRTDMHGCGCIDDANGYVTIFCAQHRDPELPDDDWDGPEPWADPARETGRHRAAELLAQGTDENWLGI